MYSKEEQLKNNKPKKAKVPFGSKPTKWNNSGKKPKQMKYKSNATAEDKEYLKWLKEQPTKCIVCSSNKTELHHLKFNETNKIHNSSAKKDHTKIVPVCIEHHRLGKCSFHSGRKELEKLFTKESLSVIASALYSKYEAIIKG